MQTYEAICDLLLDGAEDAGLHVASVEHFIETITLDKEFVFVCLPPGERTSPRVRAEISFVWDSMLTAASVYGQPHDDHETGDMELAPLSLPFGGLPLGPHGHPVIELYIKYQFNVPSAERVPELADRLRRILRGVIDHDNFPEVKFEVSVLPDGKVVVDDAFAFYWWQVDLPGDDDLDFGQIMEEVGRVLSSLAGADLGT